jgi:hypothetical protein
MHEFDENAFEIKGAMSRSYRKYDVDYSEAQQDNRLIPKSISFNNPSDLYKFLNDEDPYKFIKINKIKIVDIKEKYSTTTIEDINESVKLFNNTFAITTQKGKIATLRKQLEKAEGKLEELL